MVWQEALVLDERRRIKTELDELERASGLKARLARALAAVDELESDESSVGRLRRYVYAMSALVHHERHGGLSSRQIDGLLDLARAILRVQGVAPVTSSLSFLYGDVHLVASQIHRQNGEHWKAAWELQVAMQLSKKRAPGGPSFQALSIGIRSLRLGHAKFALQHFTRAAEDDTLSTELRRRARLYEIKALRLSGAPDVAATAAAALAQEPDLSPVETRELAWETLCRDAAATGDLRPMLNATRRGKSHGEGSYVGEARLWALASRRAAYAEELPSLRTLTEAKILVPREAGYLYKCLRQLEACQDTSYPFMTRVQALGEMLFGLHHLVAIDLELLAWLAATRWLARNNSMMLAALALKEYEAGSLRLTDGASKDALGLAGDLVGRPWSEAQAEAAGDR